MIINIIKECGYEEAALGLSLSWEKEAYNMPAVMRKLFNKDGGHSKFLESMVVWIDIVAPRYFWQQFDTYRVGTTKQSGSTMHTITKRPLAQTDFEEYIFPDTLRRLNDLIEHKDFRRLKNELPEGFLQRRIVCTNYKTLRNIIGQRMSHRLEQWQTFCYSVFQQAQHPEFLEDLIKEA